VSFAPGQRGSHVPRVPMKALHRTLAVAASLVVACSAGTSSTGGDPADGGGGADGGRDAPAEQTALTAAAAASPYLAKCKVTCAPPAGPCATSDVNACINDCTGVVEGLPVLCAQCITENSGWTGLSCDPTGAGPCHFSKNAKPSCPKKSPCEGCPPDPPCTASQEKCEGYTFAKSSIECEAECR
jgi:hypothetical protein